MKKHIPLCRNLLGCRAYLSQLKDKTGPEVIKLLWGVDICKCRRCGGVSYHTTRLFRSGTDLPGII